jgi:predicted nucleic acid-binding protein
MVVLDTSVVLKWFYGKGEEDRNKALDFMRRHLRNELQIHAPDLLLYEVTNVLVHKPGIGREVAQMSLDALKDIKLAIHWPGEEGMKISAGIAIDFGISVYDASYVALARTLEAPLITADKKLVQKAGQTDDVVLLSEAAL